METLLPFSHLRLTSAVVCHGLLLLALSYLPIAAQQNPPEPINTDRPDFTESAIVVPHRYLQVENGFTYENDRRIYTLSGPETLIRYGACKRFELRLGLPSYFSQRAGGVSASGFGDTYVGAKFQLGPTPSGLDISLIPAVFLPTGPRDFSTRTVDPELKFCLSKDLSERVSLSGMLYWSLPTEYQRRNSTLQTTLSLGWNLAKRWNVFLEYAGTFSAHAGPQHIAHSGFSYLLNDDVQLDIHYGLGLNNNSPESFIGAGVSFRFGTR